MLVGLARRTPAEPDGSEFELATGFSVGEPGNELGARGEDESGEAPARV